MFSCRAAVGELHEGRHNEVGASRLEERLQSQHKRVQHLQQLMAEGKAPVVEERYLSDVVLDDLPASLGEVLGNEMSDYLRCVKKSPSAPILAVPLLDERVVPRIVTELPLGRA